MRFASIALLFCLVLGCSSVFRNYSGEVPDSELSLLSQRGYRFRIYDQKRAWADKLRLTPGEYMIEFLLPSSGESGIARCKLAKGIDYRFEVGERRYVREFGAIVLMGWCKKP